MSQKEDAAKNNSKKKPGWQEFCPYEAEPHHVPMSGPKLLQRGTAGAQALLKRFSVRDGGEYSEAQCQKMATHLLHPNALPDQCRKYQDVMKYLKTHDDVDANHDPTGTLG